MPETADTATVAVADTTTMAQTTDFDSGPKPPGERRRPRKKLSFREPEIVGCEKYREMKERSAAESIIKSGRGEAEGAAEPAEPAESREQRDCGQVRRQESRQEGQQNGQSEDQDQGRDRDGEMPERQRDRDGAVPERQRGGSLDSQLNVRLVLRPTAAGVTSIHTESPSTPARRLPDSPSHGSMDDLELQVGSFYSFPAD